ncbi:MAG: 1-(5-phosphoribosyl)-5-[(5-phosphoribosylamino)methylideneamino]imidazole-4-carboxamide isomerase [Alphaproteobacteria bacterium]|nr:1-(5-phosphoribosyl)-5-[(5-phosphoribosylamino)methylideneamino]imidazole-4-carboxamide isomerase [Alphaproteobacteria bacterium]
MGFSLYPAIDLKGGKVVRLKRGEMDQATIYANDPATQARRFIEAGFSWVHMVDLDGAFAGKPANAAAVRAVIAAVPGAKLQLGGGIRTMATAVAWLEAGVSRIILGSAAVKDPDFARAACRAFPGHVALGIDSRDGMVATEGWAETSDVSATDLARRFEDSGAAAVIYTDIARDGMLTGVNVAATAALARAVRLPVIASGGVAGVEDITALREAGAGIEGAILGRALYDGRIEPKVALAAVA